MRKRFPLKCFKRFACKSDQRCFHGDLESSSHCTVRLQIFRQRLLLLNFFLNHMHLLVCIRPSVHYMDILCFFIVKVLNQYMRSR